MAICLVTGGAGFIGSHLVDALVAHGHVVRVLDNFSTGDLLNLAGVRDRGVELLTGDVLDLDLVRQAVRGVDWVFHLAAPSSILWSIEEPLAVHSACATGTLHVLLAAREAKVRRVIYAAASSAYGNGPSLPFRETQRTQPISPQAAAKLSGGEYCTVFSQVYNLETVRLRYFSVFGPRQQYGGRYAAVIPRFIEALLAGQNPVIHGDGLQSRDFTSIADIVQANLLAAEAPRVSGKVYNVGTGRATNLLELIDLLNTLLGTQFRPIHVAARLGEVRHSQADISCAQTELGYCPCTDLVKDLRQCVEYYARRAAPLQGPHARTVDTLLTKSR